MSEEKRINVTRSSMPDFEEYMEMIRPLWESCWLTNMGKNHEELARQLEDYLKVENVSLFTNGHMALELCLQAMELKGEVITTPFTFASTTHAIVRNGLVPVFCDINDRNFTIDVNKIESLITDKTVAILPVHVYGNMCDVEKIDKIAKKHKLKVIYDAAHAFGVKYKGISSANFGDASMFSFHATKVFNTIEGGCVCFNDDDKLVLMNDLKNFGIHDEETVKHVGGNAKMNEFQAAMGLCNLKYIDNWIEQRKQVVEHYRKVLNNISGIKLCENQANVTSNYSYFPIVFENYKYTRDEIYEKLKNKNILARKYFYPLINDLDCYKQYNSDDTPVAKYIANNVLTLPLYPDLNMKEVENICNVILNR